MIIIYQVLDITLSSSNKNTLVPQKCNIKALHLEHETGYQKEKKKRKRHIRN